MPNGLAYSATVPALLRRYLDSSVNDSKDVESVSKLTLFLPLILTLSYFYKVIDIHVFVPVYVYTFMYTALFI